MKWWYWLLLWFGVSCVVCLIMGHWLWRLGQAAQNVAWSSGLVRQRRVLMNPFEAERWEEVESSMIKAVGSRDSDLIVEFTNGDFYRYPGLAHEVDHITSAPSAGKYFHAEVRNQHCQRLGQEWPDE